MTSGPNGGWTGRLLGGRFRVGPRLEGEDHLFAGRDEAAGDPVSLLILPGPALRGVSAEALATVRTVVEHPRIARIREAIALPAEPVVLAYEPLHGETWSVRLGREGRQSELEAAAIADGVLAALQEAHAARVVHGALYPGFVFFHGEREEVRVLGFGLAATGPVAASPPESAAYVSPELARSRRREVAADLYAVGAMLYHALGGRPPYAVPNRSAALYSVLTGPPPSLESIAPDLAPGLLEVVKRAMLRRAQARYRSAAEMREALRPWSRRGAAGLVAAPLAAPAAQVPGAAGPVVGLPAAPAGAPTSPPAAPPAPTSPVSAVSQPPGGGARQSAVAPGAVGASGGPTPAARASARVRWPVVLALLAATAVLVLLFVVLRSEGGPEGGSATAPSLDAGVMPPAAVAGSPPPGGPPPSGAAASGPAATGAPARGLVAGATSGAASSHPGRVDVVAGADAGEAPAPTGQGVAVPSPDAGSSGAAPAQPSRARRRRSRRRRRRRARRRARLAVMETHSVYEAGLVHRRVNAFARRVNRCFTLGGLSRRDRRLYGWQVRVDARGQVRSVRGLGRARRLRRLDRCMRRLLAGIAWGKPDRPQGGAFELHFRPN